MRFSDVFVQEEIKKRLINTVKAQRVSHAQLFLGAEGTHTLALAIAYAQYLNCKDRTDTDSCGVCSSCVKYQTLTHPDLHFFFPNNVSSSGKKTQNITDFYPLWRELVLETNGLFSLSEWYEKIKIENKQGFISTKDVEFLLEKNQTKPYEAEYKVFILWSVDKLRHDAAPRLLKTLEEPEGKALFILITEDYDKILSTILSRTQLLKINKLSTEEMTQILTHRFDYTADAARNKVYETENNLVLASRKEDELESKKNRDLFVSFMRIAYQIHHPLLKGKMFDFNEAIDFVSALEKMGREQQKQFLFYSLSLVRKCMILDHGAASILKAPQEEMKVVQSFYQFINKQKGQVYYRYFNDAIKHIEANVNTKMLFFDLLFSAAEQLREKR